MVTFDYSKTPITQIADYIITYAAKNGSSDIHFDPRENGLMVRIRIDGELRDYSLIPEDYERNLITRLKLLSNMNITESRLPQDGSIKGNFGGISLDMRVSSLPTNEGEKIVIRILDYSRSLEGLAALGFNSSNFVKLKRMINVPNGILLVTGATGSGKSTTTYSILQTLNKKESNIITVEDPVEMNIEGLNQVQVNSEIGLDFATVLRSILRQDPNIILIGEIRDSETAKIAVRASITGHFVLSTIHTNNSLSTIERLLDMNVERYLLSSALTGIVSQRLVKTLCPKCKEKRETTKYEKMVFKKVVGMDINEIYDAHKDGCPECTHGYKGRIAIQEVLEIDDNLRDALNNENLTKEDRKAMVYKSDVITLLQDALIKILNGLTSFDEVYKSIEIDYELDDYSEIPENKIKQIKNEIIGNKTASTVATTPKTITGSITDNGITKNSSNGSTETNLSSVNEIKTVIDKKTEKNLNNLVNKNDSKEINNTKLPDVNSTSNTPNTVQEIKINPSINNNIQNKIVDTTVNSIKAVNPVNTTLGNSKDNIKPITGDNTKTNDFKISVPDTNENKSIVTVPLVSKSTNSITSLPITTSDSKK